MAQYLEKTELLKVVEQSKIDVNDLVTQDSYDEGMLVNKLKKMDKDELTLLLKASIQIAIVGAGNNNYGSIMNNGKEIALTDIFNRNNVEYRNSKDTKLVSDQLTARRLNRLFRFQIQDFIKRTGRSSYLYRKYDYVKNPKMIHIVFPGAEHVVEKEEEVKYLFQVYKNLDEKLNITSFKERFNRVLIARNVLKTPLI
jgi:hypothetical protein